MTKKTKKPTCTCPRPDIHKALAKAAGLKEINPKRCLDQDQQAKVWVVVRDTDYEGLDPPVAAFTNREPAYAMADTLNKCNGSKYSRYDVIETDLGMGNHQGYFYGV